MARERIPRLEEVCSQLDALLKVHGDRVSTSGPDVIAMTVSIGPLGARGRLAEANPTGGAATSWFASLPVGTAKSQSVESVSKGASRAPLNSNTPLIRSYNPNRMAPHATRNTLGPDRTYVPMVTVRPMASQTPP